MSVKKRTITYGAAALVLAFALIAASAFYMGFPIGPGGTSAVQGQSALSIRLTDPPHVPASTTSLNLTYSKLTLLVGEPSGTQGQRNITSLTVTPSGGQATVDLLKLQNVSQTIALASIPNDSVLYSVTFVVSNISIDVNGTVSPVSLATGGDTFTVAIAGANPIGSGDFALLQLNPVVVDTPSGYQMIPSAVGIMGHEGNHGQDNVGSEHQLTSENDQELERAHGNLTAVLTDLSVTGNSTTLSATVSNTGNATVQLLGLGLHGNFTVVGNVCQPSYHNNETQTQTHETENHTTTTTTNTENHTQSMESGFGCMAPEHTDQVVFIPAVQSNATNSNGCMTGTLSLVNGSSEEDHPGITLTAGQCVELTFSGQLSFGESHFILVPSTSAGQTYILHVIASNGANEQLSCVLPAGTASCSVIAPNSEQDD